VLSKYGVEIGEMHTVALDGCTILTLGVEAGPILNIVDVVIEQMRNESILQISY
jgi:hypothetical protein